MLKNYLRTAVRILWRNRLHTGINILGLSMGIGVCLTIFVFIYTFLDQDTFHANAADIYMIGHIKSVNNGEERWGFTPAALGPSVKAQVPEVRRSVRIDNFDASVRYGDNVFKELVWLADPGFFDMFTFPLVEGDANALEDPSAIFLNEETANKYFGKEQALGKTMTVRFDQTHKYDLVVRGIIRKAPRNASFSFALLAGYKLVEALTPKANGWDYGVAATFLQLAPGSNARSVESKIQSNIATYNAVNPDRLYKAFYIDNVLDLAKNSNRTRGDISRGANPTGLIALSIIAALLMLMACFNFMNNMIAGSARRFKEIGVRKVLGGQKRQLLLQFLGESLIVSFLALVIGLGLAEAAFAPFMNTLIDGHWIAFDIFSDYPLLMFMGLLIAAIGIISGLYPSLYMSTFQPVKIFRDLQRVTSNKFMTRILVVLQFAICLFAIVAAIVFKINNDYFTSLDLGFKGDQVAVLNFNSNEEYERFEAAILRTPGVEQISGSIHQAGRSQSVGMTAEAEGKTFQSNLMRVGAGYIETLGIRIVEGRSFDPALKTDEEQSVMINQTLASQLGWQQPVGKIIRIEGKECTVIGVAGDFYTRTFMRPVEPTLMKVIPKSAYRLMSIKMQSNNAAEVVDAMKTEWKKLMPDTPFELSFQDQVFEEDFVENENIKNMFIYVAVMTMIIAAMGLFALVSMNIARRTKEIGIRKVLGASAPHIMNLVNREFYVLIIVAAALIFPVAYIALNGLMNSVFSSHAPITVVPFISAIVAMLLLAVLTVGSRVYRIATENPVEALRYE
ncbi:ABC transporter permease [bacterium]|nr:ABC transporter permease [bacterium]